MKKRMLIARVFYDSLSPENKKKSVVSWVSSSNNKKSVPLYWNITKSTTQNTKREKRQSINM